MFSFLPRTGQSPVGQGCPFRERPSGLQEWRGLDGNLPFPARLANRRFVPNAVYRGSPKNVRFRAATIPTSMSDMRRLPPVCSILTKQSGGQGETDRCRSKIPERCQPGILHPAENYWSATVTLCTSGVVGRPIRAESWRPSSNRAPCDAAMSQPAMACAIPSGRPAPTSALA